MPVGSLLWAYGCHRRQDDRSPSARPSGPLFKEGRDPEGLLNPRNLVLSRFSPPPDVFIVLSLHGVRHGRRHLKLNSSSSSRVVDRELAGQLPVNLFILPETWSCREDQGR